MTASADAAVLPKKSVKTGKAGKNMLLPATPLTPLPEKKTRRTDVFLALALLFFPAHPLFAATTESGTGYHALNSSPDFPAVS